MRQQKSNGTGTSKRSPRMPSANVEAEPVPVSDPESVASPDEISAFMLILRSTLSSEPFPVAGSLRDEPAYFSRARAVPPPTAFSQSVGSSDEALRPGTVSFTDDLLARDAAAFQEVARVLGAAETWLAVVDESTGLMPIAARDALKAEMGRATALLQLLRFLKGDFAPPRDTVSCEDVVRRVLQSVESERRLRGITVTTPPVLTELSVVGDESLLAHVLFALVIATFSLLEGVRHPRVVVSLAASGADVVLSVIQEQAPATRAWADRPLGATWTDAEGGVFGAVAMSAAEQIAARWGGRFAVRVAAHSTNVSICLPAVRSAVAQPDAM